VFYEKVEEIEHPKKMNAHPPNKFVVLLLQYFSLKANILYKSTHDTFLSKKICHTNQPKISRTKPTHAHAAMHQLLSHLPLPSPSASHLPIEDTTFRQRPFISIIIKKV
jgi:hypothetical protein